MLHLNSTTEAMMAGKPSKKTAAIYEFILKTVEKIDNNQVIKGQDIEVLVINPLISGIQIDECFIASQQRYIPADKI